MNWPLWKRELRGKSWWRFLGTLAAIALIVIAIQVLRSRSDSIGSPSEPGWFCLGLFGLERTLMYFPSAPQLSAKLNLFLLYPDVRAPLLGTLALAVVVALLMARSFLGMDGRGVDELRLTSVRSRDLAIAVCLRPWILIAFALAVFAISEMFLWTRTRVPIPFPSTGHSHMNVWESIRADGTSTTVDAVMLTQHGWHGLSAEIILRLAIIALLMVTAALVALRHLRRPLGVGILLAALLATIIGQVPEITRCSLLHLFPPPGVTAPVPPTESGRPRAQYHDSLHPMGFTMGTNERGVIERMRRAATEESPSDLSEGFRQLRWRQRHEEIIIWISYLVPTAVWMLLWLWWAKRFFLRSFLRE